mmetsp:Transcript_30516/g.89206  ORF Transcript_30516/g.89206 Transcript_30516/m.89206 type:complete len:242 (+) Transcript_30516:235-960(+)
MSLFDEQRRPQLFSQDSYMYHNPFNIHVKPTGRTCTSINKSQKLLPLQYSIMSSSSSVKGTSNVIKSSDDINEKQLAIDDGISTARSLPQHRLRSSSADSLHFTNNRSSSCSLNIDNMYESDDDDLDGELNMFHVDSLSLLQDTTFKSDTNANASSTTTRHTSTTRPPIIDDDSKLMQKSGHSSMNQQDLYGWFETSLNNIDNNEDSGADSLIFSHDSSLTQVINGARSAAKKDEKAAKTA